jgi:hypothetical protein
MRPIHGHFGGQPMAANTWHPTDPCYDELKSGLDRDSRLIDGADRANLQF